MPALFFAFSKAEIVDLNSAQGVDVCVSLIGVCVVLYAGSDLATG
jgi:hypothetical protein